MKVDTRNIVSVSQAQNKGTSWLVSQAEDGHTMLIMRNSEPAAVVTSVETMSRLEGIEELESDLRLMAATIARMVADTGERHDLDEVLTELGIEVEPDE